MTKKQKTISEKTKSYYSTAKKSKRGNKKYFNKQVLSRINQTHIPKIICLYNGNSQLPSNVVIYVDLGDLNFTYWIGRFHPQFEGEFEFLSWEHNNIKMGNQQEIEYKMIETIFSDPNYKFVTDNIIEQQNPTRFNPNGGPLLAGNVCTYGRSKSLSSAIYSRSICKGESTTSSETKVIYQHPATTFSRLGLECPPKYWKKKLACDLMKKYFTEVKRKHIDSSLYSNYISSIVKWEQIFCNHMKEAKEDDLSDAALGGMSYLLYLLALSKGLRVNHTQKLFSARNYCYFEYNHKQSVVEKKSTLIIDVTNEN